VDNAYGDRIITEKYDMYKESAVSWERLSFISGGKVEPLNEGEAYVSRDVFSLYFNESFDPAKDNYYIMPVQITKNTAYYRADAVIYSSGIDYTIGGKKVIGVKIVGVFDTAGDYREAMIIQSDEGFGAFAKNAVYATDIRIATPAAKAEQRQLFRWMGKNDLYPNIVNTRVYYEIANVMGIFTQVFAYLSIILGLFAVVLMYNYINTSIAGGKRNIGILRALGARGRDIMKIYLFESGILAVLVIIFSSILTIIFTDALDKILVSQIRVFINSPLLDNIRILFLSPLPFILTFLSTVLVMFISTVYPIYRISRKKPIDIINDR